MLWIIWINCILRMQAMIVSYLFSADDDGGSCGSSGGSDDIDDDNDDDDNDVDDDDDYVLIANCHCLHPSLTHFTACTSISRDSLWAHI